MAGLDDTVWRSRTVDCMEEAGCSVATNTIELELLRNLDRVF